tara:strand:- start:817 stop:1443 length:627 start_codon:yes stop_codon:yes gene_type:complete
MYRIFINDCLLILSSFETFVDLNDTSEIHTYLGSSSMNNAINKLQNGLCDSLILKGHDIDLMWRDFCSRYDLIEAAGGIVLNSNAEVLWIFRNGRWDLPKGKVEQGETCEDAAVREVQEECGISEINLGDFFGVTYHTYSFNSKEILKKTFWYGMTCSSNLKLQPQLDEGITKVVWADKSTHLLCLSATYKTIVELLSREKVQHYLDF